MAKDISNFVIFNSKHLIFFVAKINTSQIAYLICDVTVKY